MSKTTFKKIFEHPDKEEILTKLCIGTSEGDIYEWLDSKYQDVGEKKFIISEKNLKEFKDEYLDVYTMMKEDLEKTKRSMSTTPSNSDNFDIAMQHIPAYQNLLVETANQELDIRKTLKHLASAIEKRMGQVFDAIQDEPEMVNTRVDNLLISYAELFGGLLEKYYKFTEAPEITSIHNTTNIQIVDQHISIMHDTIKEIIQSMGLEDSMRFIELLNKNISKLKPSKEDFISQEDKLLETKLLNDEVLSRLGE